MATILKFCKDSNTPVTAVKCEPYYDEDKKRVSKGKITAHKGWRDAKKYQKSKATMTPYSTEEPTMWLMDLKSNNLYVIDVDVKNGKTAKEIMKESVYDKLFTLSEYVVETGSKGIHFYFKLNEGAEFVIKNYTNIEASAFLKDDEIANGTVDVIMDAVIAEGSSYTYEKNIYTYQRLKNSFPSDADVWSEFTDFYKTFLQQENNKEHPVAGNTNIIELNEVADHLENIPNNQRNWEAWYRMGQTIFNIVGSEDGSALFHNWSKKNVEMYDEKKTSELWRGLKNNRDKKLYIGSLLYLSKKANETQYSIIRKKYNPLCYEALKDLLEFNHFFVEEPKPMYVRIGNNELIHYTPMNFKDLLMSWTVTISGKEKDKEVSFFNEWVKDPNKRKYKRIGYYPKESDCPCDEFNGFFPIRASTLPKNTEPVCIQKFIDHISIMANHDVASRNFIIKAFAQIVKEPSVIKGICLMFYAKEGAGKDILISLFGQRVLGSHLYHFAGNIENLFKNFNADMYGKLLIHVDELVKLKPKDLENFKRIITASMIRLEKKGIDAQTIAWLGRIMATTNNNDAFNSASMSDRRLHINHSSNEKIKDIDYFKDFYAFMNDDKNCRAIYDYLMEQDVSDFNHTTRPETEFHRQMKTAAIDKVLLWILNAVDDFTEDTDKAVNWLIKYNSWAEKNKERQHNITSFGLAVNKLIDGGITCIKKTKPHNISHLTFEREGIMEYLKKEGLMDADIEADKI